MLVSGLSGEGLPELVETISAVAEMQELKAEQDGPVYGHVLESNFHKGLGSVSSSVPYNFVNAVICTGLLLLFWCSVDLLRLGPTSSAVSFKARCGG